MLLAVHLSLEAMMYESASSLPVVQRPNSNGYRLAKPEVEPPARSAVGFLLLDSALRPVSFNAEALQVLSYPDRLADVRHPIRFLAERIRMTLLSERPSRESPLVTEFRSGRRQYRCRAFVVDSDAKGPSDPSVAVLLERAPFGLSPWSPVVERLNLTRRERHVLDCLLQGLSNKEIANRMTVSPNTVKAFLRLIMMKMGVSSRSEIMAKIMMALP
jgi:DNA-binding CsgD family transcriptional regulator